MGVDEGRDVLGREGEDRLPHRRHVPGDTRAERAGEPQRHVGLDLQHHDRIVAVEHAERARLMCHPGEHLELRARRGDAVAACGGGEQEQRIGPDAVSLRGGVVGEQTLAHQRGEDPVRRRRGQLDGPGDLGERHRRVRRGEEPQDRDGPFDRLGSRLPARVGGRWHGPIVARGSVAARVVGITTAISRRGRVAGGPPIRRRATRRSGSGRVGRG